MGRDGPWEGPTNSRYGSDGVERRDAKGNIIPGTGGRNYKQNLDGSYNLEHSDSDPDEHNS